MNINTKNHFKGDFNIYIFNKTYPSDELISQEVLNNLIKNEYIQGFQGKNKLSNDSHGNTCIDNIFLKSDRIMRKTFKITSPVPVKIKKENIDYLNLIE